MLLLAIRSIANEVYIFQHDNAPAHCAYQTEELLHRKTPDPNSLPPTGGHPRHDGRPYLIWLITTLWCMNESTKSQYMMCQSCSRVDEHRAGFQQNVVDEATDQWRKRLDACVRAQGHFEHQLGHTCVFHDCITRVYLATFITSSCCCNC